MGCWFESSPGHQICANAHSRRQCRRRAYNQAMPQTRYTKAGDVHIAYQVVGSGPIDVVFVPGVLSHVDWWWEEPRAARFFNRIASYARLILFDKRGLGASDRSTEWAPLEERM